MKKIIIALALVALVVGATQSTDARTRVSVGFSYGSLYHRPVYSYAYCRSSVVYTYSYPRYRHRVHRYRPAYAVSRYRERPYALRNCW